MAFPNRSAWYSSIVSRQAGNDRPIEKAFLDAIRYGLISDAGSARQLAGRLLRRPPSDVSDVESFRQQLGQVLISSDPTNKSAMRRTSASAPVLPRDSDSTLPLVIIGPDLALDPPVLNDSDSTEVHTFVREQRQADRLATAGLTPARTLLLVGAPGVGKTMTAQFIAASLELPLVSLDLATLMSSYLGRTGQNLRRALDYARDNLCVLFLDEFDALAKRRDDDGDIGELKRLVNVLLLELDRWPNDSILIAATNHPELLDRAIERRFDMIIELGLPSIDSRQAIIASCLHSPERGIARSLTKAFAAVTDGWSGSDLARLCRLVLRREVLDGEPVEVAMAQEVVRALSDQVAGQESTATAREAFASLAMSQGGLTQRDVARLMGISHPTVGRLARRWDARETEGGSDDRGA